MAVGLLCGAKVLVADNDLKSQLKQRGFGSDEKSALVLGLVEACYLSHSGKLEIASKEEILDFEGFLKYCSKQQKDFYQKFLVYRDLRERGLLVRTGLKFGTDYRVYERGAKLGKGHSIYLVHVVPEEYQCSMAEMARALRLAKTVNKDMIYAIVDGESDITYYMVDRLRL